MLSIIKFTHTLRMLSDNVVRKDLNCMLSGLGFMHEVSGEKQHFLFLNCRQQIFHPPFNVHGLFSFSHSIIIGVKCSR